MSELFTDLGDQGVLHLVLPLGLCANHLGNLNFTLRE